MQQRFSGVNVDSLRFTDLPDSSEFVVRLRGLAPAYGQAMADSTWVLPALQLAPMATESSRDARRTNPLVLETANVRESMRLVVPGSWGLVSPAAPAQLRSEFGSWSESITMAEGEVRWTREFSRARQVVAPGRYGDWRSFQRAVERARRSAMVMRRVPGAASR